MKCIRLTAEIGRPLVHPRRVELRLLPPRPQAVAPSGWSAVEQHNAGGSARPSESRENERRSRLTLEDQETLAASFQPGDPFVRGRLLPSLRTAERARHFFQRRYADRVEVEAGDVWEAARRKGFDGGRLADARRAGHE